MVSALNAERMSITVTGVKWFDFAYCALYFEFRYDKGEVVYPGDIRRQTERMWENVEALLKEAECTFDDLGHMIVYLRDIADYAVVKSMYDKCFPDTPKVFVHAPVCRPGWLIEMECMGVKALKNKEYAPF